jgi:ABC-type nitrate/sulfonate/bicarbonate transport system permease component
VGIGIAVVVTVVVEMMSGFAGGLGNYISELQGATRTPEAYSAIVAVALLGSAIAGLLGYMERRFLAWHRSQMGRA